jgi:hypothetical protein
MLPSSTLFMVASFLLPTERDRDIVHQERRRALLAAHVLRLGGRRRERLARRAVR